MIVAVPAFLRHRIKYVSYIQAFYIYMDLNRSKVDTFDEAFPQPLTR